MQLAGDGRDMPALRRDRLLWVDQNYVRDETLRAANNLCGHSAEERLAYRTGWNLRSGSPYRTKFPEWFLRASRARISKRHLPADQNRFCTRAPARLSSRLPDVPDVRTASFSVIIKATPMSI